MGMRRYDVDSIKVIALGLLIVYHCLVGFQAWGPLIGFIGNEQHLEGLWIVFELLNIWRIPILFVVSGMGVSFAMQRRNWKELLKDRTYRILVPYIFGFFLINPIFSIFFQIYYEKPLWYVPNPGHLWFLLNIFFYVLLLFPVFIYFKNNPNNFFIQILSKIIKKPLGVMILFGFPIMVEAILINPKGYSAFVFEPIHGPLMGLICFFIGFVSISLGDKFWEQVKNVKWLCVFIAIIFYLIRIFLFRDSDSFPKFLVNLLTSFEATNWMLAAFGFSATFLNKPSKTLSYLSVAVYPVYIVHLPLQNYLASLIFGIDLPAIIKFILLVFATFLVSFVLFEIIRRIKKFRFFFGMKP